MVLFAALGNVNTYKRSAYAGYATARPAYQVWTTGHGFGADIKRVSGDPNTPIEWKRYTDSDGTWGWKTRHHYSKDQPWNVTGAVMAVDCYDNTSGSARGCGHFYLDGVTYDPLWPKCTTYDIGEDRWLPDANYPYVRVNVKNRDLDWFDVSTCTLIKRITLPSGFSPKGIGDGEGNLSRDGRYIVLHDASRMLLVDMWNNDVGPFTDLSTCGLRDDLGVIDCSVDWASISPNGNYAVVSVNDFLRVYDVHKPTLVMTARTYDPSTYECYNHLDPNGLYDPNGMATGADPNTGSIFGLGHADMTISTYDANAEVIVGQKRSWCPDPPAGEDPNIAWGSVQLVRLDTGAVRALTMSIDPNDPDEASSWHLSARNTGRDGWVYATYWPKVLKIDSVKSYWLSDPNVPTRFNDEIVAISLDPNLLMDPNAGIERLANTHSSRYFKNGPDYQYRAEPQFVPHQLGIKGTFGSNWYLDCTGTNCDPNSRDYFETVHMYIMDSTYLRTGEHAGGVPKRLYYRQPPG